jgi:hypothetical protein
MPKAQSQPKAEALRLVPVLQHRGPWAVPGSTQRHDHRPIVAGGAVIVTAWVIASGPGFDRAPEAQRNTAGANGPAAALA